MLIGSEGILGVITEAWVRVHERPAHKASAAVAFQSFAAGAEAVRALGAVRPQPLELPVARPDRGRGHRCRRLRARGRWCSASSPPISPSTRSSTRPSNSPATLGARSRPGDGTARDERPGAAGGGDSAWRDAFLSAPYLRDSLVACGVLSETFETAITWDRFEEFHATVIETAARAAGDEAKVMCRFTHLYPDGPAPYFTILAPARRGSEVEQWDEIKAAVSEALIAGGGTITHHHAVGRDHRPWYDRQRPDQFAAALRAAKTALDPGAVLNPGVLIDT